MKPGTRTAAILALAGLSACQSASTQTPQAQSNQEVSARPVSGTRLIYPADMMNNGIEGAVDATCDVDVQGATSDCVVTKVEGSMIFADAALAFVRSARYKPAVRDGIPVKEPHHVFTIKFVLDPLDGQLRQGLSQVSEDWALCVAPGSATQAAIDACGRALDLSTSAPILQEAAREIRGRDYAARADYVSAIADFDGAIATGAAEILVYQERGLAEVTLSNFTKAQADFDFVLEALPNDLPSLKGRSRAERGMSDFAAAYRDLDHAIQVRPDDPSLRIQRGEISSAAGDATQALRDLDDALRLNPTEVPALIARCQVQRSLNRLVEAAADCARAEKLDPKHRTAALP